MNTKVLLAISHENAEIQLVFRSFENKQFFIKVIGA